MCLSLNLNSVCLNRFGCFRIRMLHHCMSLSLRFLLTSESSGSRKRKIETRECAQNGHEEHGQGACVRVGQGCRCGLPFAAASGRKFN